MAYQNKIKKSKLKGAIAIYDNDRVSYYDYNQETGEMSAGKPLNEDSLRRIFKFVNKMDVGVKYSFADLIPSNVISFSTDELNICWYTEPTVQHQYFAESLEAQLPSGEYPVPHLIWKLTKRGLSVMALKRNPKSMSEKIYQSPFFNTAGSGGICMGNAKYVTKSSSYEILMDFAMRAFFGSIFTHSSVNDLVKGNFIEVMASLKGKKRFDTKLLVQRTNTIKYFCNGHY